MLEQIMPNHYTILQITISDTPTPTQPPKSPTQRFILAYYRQIMPTHHTNLQITISHTVSGQNPIGIYIIGLALILYTAYQQNIVSNNQLLKSQRAVKKNVKCNHHWIIADCNATILYHCSQILSVCRIKTNDMIYIPIMFCPLTVHPPSYLNQIMPNHNHRVIILQYLTVIIVIKIFTYPTSTGVVIYNSVRFYCNDDCDEPTRFGKVYKWRRGVLSDFHAINFM